MQKILKMSLLTLCGLAILGCKEKTNKPPVQQSMHIESLTSSYKPIAKTLAEEIQQQAPTLNPVVLEQALTTVECANKYQLSHNNILTIIDYSLPSSHKRLWVFDLITKKLLFHTYVAHGINSGALFSTYFSNKNNSRASSIGLYKTDRAYGGREGTSLKLAGLDRQFNDNADSRAVVMHGGWYVEEDFIQKYGRAGRSWGCPALPATLTTAIINKIKDNSLMVIYYPSDQWLIKSKWLNCQNTSVASRWLNGDNSPLSKPVINRRDILLGSIHQNKHEREEIIVTMPAVDYVNFFVKKAPLTRMLRRQVDKEEYIALSKEEFDRLIMEKTANSTAGLDKIFFVSPSVKMRRGYAVTEMHKVNLGKITQAHWHGFTVNDKEDTGVYTLDFAANRSLNFTATHRFIRWLGL